MPEGVHVEGCMRMFGGANVRGLACWEGVRVGVHARAALRACKPADGRVESQVFACGDVHAS